jgi:hypothetical protein
MASVSIKQRSHTSKKYIDSGSFITIPCTFRLQTVKTRLCLHNCQTPIARQLGFPVVAWLILSLSVGRGSE